MDYLTVKEVAELKGCSERFIRKLINNGDLSSEEVVNRANGHKSHSIPISALPDELQQRYYKQQRSDAGASHLSLSRILLICVVYQRQTALLTTLCLSTVSERI